jgi:hypothetical protein
MPTQLEVAQAKKIERMRMELLRLEGVLHAQNIKLDAMHWVWCTGACASGSHKWVHGELTEELVVTAENAVRRMRESYANITFRKKRHEVMVGESVCLTKEAQL